MLKGDRLMLRAITREDLPRYVSWLNDPEVTQYLGHLPPFNLDDEIAWYERQRDDHNVLHLAIDTPEGIHIGTVSLMDIDWRSQKAVLGIVIGLKSDWGKGYGTEAINILLEYAFNTLNLNRVFLQVEVAHQGGITCYQRCGFTQEGELRQEIYRDGQFRNMYVMGILRSEYVQRAT